MSKIQANWNFIQVQVSCPCFCIGAYGFSISYFIAANSWKLAVCKLSPLNTTAVPEVSHQLVDVIVLYCIACCDDLFLALA